MDTVRIIYDNRSFNADKHTLMSMKYFRDLFTENPDLVEIEIPDSEYTQAIVSIIKKEAPKDTLSDLVKFIIVSDHLNIPRDLLERNVLRYLADINHLSEAAIFFDIFVQLNMIGNVASIYEKLLTVHTKYNDHIVITPLSFDLKGKETLSRLIPYMKIFARAFVICDMYNLDYNSITAEPTVRDMFIYQTTTSRLNTRDVCNVYAQARQKLDTFLGYFDICDIIYGFPLPRDGYPLFEPDKRFRLNLLKDLTKEWVLGNCIMYDPNVDQQYLDYTDFYVLGKTKVKDLPVNVTNEILFSDIVLQDDSLVDDWIAGVKQKEEVKSSKPFPIPAELPKRLPLSSVPFMRSPSPRYPRLADINFSPSPEIKSVPRTPLSPYSEFFRSNNDQRLVPSIRGESPGINRRLFPEEPPLYLPRIEQEHVIPPLGSAQYQSPRSDELYIRAPSPPSVNGYIRAPSPPSVNGYIEQSPPPYRTPSYNKTP